MSHELERSQTGMTQQVNQGHVRSPKPISATMRPTCDSEAKQSADLMSVWTLPIRYANTAVAKPVTTTNTLNTIEHSRMGLVQEQERPQVNGKGAVEDRAGRGWPFHRPRQPTGERDQSRFAGGSDQEQ